MEEVLTILHADNGIVIKYDEYVEVVEYTHNADGKDKDNLYQRLGRTFYKSCHKRNGRRDNKQGTGGNQHY